MPTAGACIFTSLRARGFAVSAAETLTSTCQTHCHISRVSDAPKYEIDAITASLTEQAIADIAIWRFTLERLTLWLAMKYFADIFVSLVDLASWNIISLNWSQWPLKSDI